ncbi:hypothetical protein ABFS83_06G142700 [Erythranthe nasuta]
MYDLVEKYMIHGPCGLANQNTPYMKDEISTKRFLKSFVNRTEADVDGYPMYRRRESGRTVVKKKTNLDNGFVVPYNRALLKMYRAHINVELCNLNKSIKYLLKYINEGHDRVTATFYQSNNPGATYESRDKIKMYYDCRYLSACEAARRLFSFDISFRDPPMIILSFHLPSSQAVVFTDNDSLVDLLNKPTTKQIMFYANKLFPKARNLRYKEFPQKNVYKEKTRCWMPRKIGFSIGKITNVPPGRGCTCYDDLRKVEDHVYPTFKDYIADINETNECANGDYVGRLFVVLLVANNMSRPEYVWECCWKEFTDDIAYRLQQRYPHVSGDTLRNYVLIEIENILQNNSKSLSNFPPMPIPIGLMTDATENVFDDIMDVVTNDRGGLKTLSAVICSKGKIVINVASSGIASFLLPGGRTAHSRFRLPIILIICDEALMMHMYFFEALDKTIKSILDSDMPFGGKVVVLGGDFRQILLFVLKASRQDIVHSTINSSLLWRQCKVMMLNRNMRLQLSSSSANADEIREFVDWILRIGNGDAGEVNDGDAIIEIPNDLLIHDSADPFLDLIEFVYPDLVRNLFTPDYFEDRAVLSPTNESVGFVNDHFLSTITREDKLLSDINAEIYRSECLNTISCSGIPSHKLTLKRGVPVMLIRNIDQARGLCNGTRLQVINMETTMTLVSSNSGLPIKFQQHQFPLMVSFVMTINKSKRQTLSHLYVALSRVNSRSGIKILMNSESGDATNVTNYVVYKEVFQRK